MGGVEAQINQRKMDHFHCPVCHVAVSPESLCGVYGEHSQSFFLNYIYIKDVARRPSVNYPHLQVGTPVFINY